MKPIKMTDNDKLELKSVYKDLNDEQLYEVFLGEKAGIDFNSYAQKDISAEEMKKTRIMLEDVKRKNTAIFECKYFSGDVKELSCFYNASELLLKYLFNEEIKGVSYKDIERWAGVDGVLQGKLNKITDYLISDRSIINGYEKEEKILPEAFSKLAEGFKIEKCDNCIWFYPSINKKADIYKTFGKNGQSKLKGITLTEDSAFAIRDVIPGYNENYYSLGFTCSDLSFGIATHPNNTATKASARIEVVFCDNTTVFVDDLSKYIDTSLLTVGLKS